MSTSLPDEFAQKRQQLLDAYQALPEITLYGVVGASGPRGSKWPPRKLWSFNLELIAWRLPDQAVKHSPLRMEKDVADDELEALREVINAESLIALRCKLCENSPYGDTRAQFVSLLPAPKDEELAAVLAQFQQPVEMQDPVLGKLVLEKAEDCFEGEINWLGQQIPINLCLDEDGKVLEALETAKALMAEMPQWGKKINDFAVAELLPLKNDEWLEEDASPVTAEEFLARMQLTSISTFADGGFSFWHTDGDLFFGHAIMVTGSLDEGPTDADIPG